MDINIHAKKLSATLQALALAALLFPVSLVAQETLEHGHGAMQVFDKEGMANTPKWVMVWIGFMALTFLTGSIFVKNHKEARWVVGAFVSGMIVSSLLSAVLDIPPLSGYIALMHIVFWTPALIVLLKRRPFLARPVSIFSIWSGLITFVILFSFIFDIRDAAIFLGNSF